jgi:hypothetical protein
MTRQSAKNKLEQVCKGAALVQFKVISPHLPGWAEENHEKNTVNISTEARNGDLRHTSQKR